MDQDLRERTLRKLPILLINGQSTALYSYKIADGGIYFSELREDFSGAQQVNFTNSYVLLNTAGRTYRDQHVSALMQENLERALFSALAEG